MFFENLSDEDLIAGLKAACGEERRLVARIVAYLVEVEERRIHLEAACSSLFDFCIRRLGMSEGQAYRRINAARLVRRFPSVLARIERGEIHLSALAQLRHHLTDANHAELLDEARGKSKREVQELLARRAPKPDVPNVLRKLPTPTAPPMPPARIEPLSEARYRLQLTVSAELRDKLERATALMRHRNPSGDLAVVVESGIDLLVAKLEQERLRSTTRPQRKKRPAK